MAKKITLDFSKVEERTGWKTDHMEEGLHEFKVELVDDKDAADGTRMWTYGLRPTNPKYKTRLFPYYCKDQPNQMFKIRELLIAAGIKVPKGRYAFDPNSPLGKIVAAEVQDSSNPQYAGRSEINGVYSTDILEDQDGVEPDEDDEEEDEVDEDEVEEEEEDDEESLEDELNALTLVQLRKRAKDLGIDTAGLKKDELIESIIEEEEGEEADDDEEEDDLGDEDLEDEDLEDEEFEDEDEEDEEEEPEPAPRRRAPAKKAAPAAKAAPARRTVKRR